MDTSFVFASVERIFFYSDLTPEPPVTNDVQFAVTEGQITFEKVSMRYRKHLDLALRKVSFTIAAGERIGVVGRTGSGKSSIIQVLFRMNEIESGAVMIDGQDISKPGIHALRG